MTSVPRKIDLFFLITVSVLTITGFVIFLSASLGYLAQDEASFRSIALKQGVSLVIGVIAFFIFSRLHYSILRKSALFILIGALIVNLLLLIPGLALHYNGASRWIDLGFVTFQPSELLKIAFIIYLAAWVHFVKDKISTFRYGFIPYLFIIGIMSAFLLIQRDTDTLAIIAGTGLVMFTVAGMRIRYALLAICVMAILLVGVVFARGYAMDRIQTFLNRGADTQGSGYQINQSLIAIGSGQIAGRGFGQSVQKFGYLPQPTDDSIFAVAAEEFGFLGSVFLIILYVLLAASMFRIGNRAPDVFSGLTVIGIAVLIITESFMNMAAMLGLLPLSGVPLLFVSHGGTALILTLVTAGIVANVSKYAKA